ncbi:MAG: DNA mismatch repair protein MutS [Rhizobiales bacterium 24-66-13]|jgi:DNA-nicking Smr family endonuclease|nr:MAG: DNA mismatch repair protein MutS [Rhizobiales bacterium 12-66-7]OYY82239.1 MAG: DNA mismatch repair protein MutS [Rhizobiales bacterium 35-66-30]OYZ72367.1 MAG: DNA mismatch repair protein MutS [Rhizobiales bacterium 24-66-13]OZB02677.1 MAG: DNA mismatch repair protein MutS [Rhizobiales bacterium 39-66-18]HQS09997.1 Smr/MutS family protein [Xanthobacteraceae bacterium]
MSRRGRRRLLNAEERELWQHVVRSVAPLRAAPRPLAPPPAPIAAPEPPASEPAAPVPETPATKTPATKTRILKPTGSAAARRALEAPTPPPLSVLDPKVRRRLTRGGEVDARLDLHGLTQAAAHRQLLLFVVQAQAAGHSLVLVITGKGDPETVFMTGTPERGVLRRAVPQWLSDATMRPYVVGFESAARRHGGDGALYIRIRRRRGAREPLP